MSRLNRVSIATVWLACAAVATSASGAVTQLRRPVGIVATGDRVMVANRRSGTVSVIDARSLRVVQELAVGRTLSGFVGTPDGRSAYATDEAAGELIRLGRGQDGTLRLEERVNVPAYPVSVVVADDDASASVACLWSRRVAIVDLAGPSMRVRSVIDLPFAPGEQWVGPRGNEIVVADAFGGELAIVDSTTGKLVARRSIQAHNIRGLHATPDGRELLVAHQILDPNTPTESSRITWGQVVGDVLRAVPTSEVIAAGGSRRSATLPEPIRHWSLYPLGINGHGAGDPGAIAVSRSGFTAVALSGVNEVALRNGPLDAFKRIAVGRRPTAITFSPDSSRLYVANTFDDSVSVIDVSAPTSAHVVTTISLGLQPELTEENRGETLFYDARLSLDGWYSCSSCHTDGHTNGLRNDNFTDGSYGTPKQIPSLLGVGSTRPFGWFGQVPTHEAQIRRSILGTMHGPSAAASDESVNAIAAFLRTLRPPPGVSTARCDADLTAVARGRAAFDELGCARCHAPPDYTSERVWDVGLRDEAGASRFSPPSLLGVSQRERFLHDGRAGSLGDVFMIFGHPDGKPLDRAKSDDLVAFIRSL